MKAIAILTPLISKQYEFVDKKTNKDVKFTKIYFETDSNDLIAINTTDIKFVHDVMINKNKQTEIPILLLKNNADDTYRIRFDLSSGTHP